MKRLFKSTSLLLFSSNLYMSLCRSDFSFLKIDISLTSIRVYLSCLFILVCLRVNAQTISSQVVGSAGNTLLSPHMKLSWTLGEVAVARWDAFNNTGTLTEGFHQPTITWSDNDLSALELVQIVPNPVKNILNLNVLAADDETYYLGSLQDVQGKILIKNLQLRGKIELNMSGYSAGVYFLSIHSSAGVPLQHHKIIKL